VGALDYISPEATVASAFVMQAPGKILEDVLGKGLGPIPPASETGFDLKEVSGALGGEFAFAIDGSVLPTPAWKLVVEVYDPNRLRLALQKMVETVDAKAKAEGKPALRTSQETVNGRTYYMIAGADENPLTQAHYLFDGGYLVLAANRTLLDRALQYRATGYTLTKSPQFAALVPRDHYANFSGMLYYNVAGTVSQYGGLLSSFMNDQQKKMLHDLSTSKPTLVTAYGEPDRIALAGSGSLFDISLVNLVTGNVVGGGLPFGGGKRPARQ
jgi:hypothetical protein